MNTTTKNFPGEEWKEVQFDFDFINDFRLEVSNYGRLKTYNKISDGNIVQGSTVNGYSIIRLKFFKARSEEMEAQLKYHKDQVNKLAKKLKELKKAKAESSQIQETAALLKKLKSNLSKKYKADLKNRTIHYHSLVHRLVATYFLPKPKPDETIVAHLDFNKSNNKVSNVKWMTPEENYKHQQHSPYVINEKKERTHRRKELSKATKLTVTKVMLLKKLLNEGKPMKQLVKQFKITDTQILRIKKGENWGDVEAAK